MQQNACMATKFNGTVLYVIRHESGAWYNYRNGPHVDSVEHALIWEDKTVAEETAAMLTRGAHRGRYEAVPLQV